MAGKALFRFDTSELPPMGADRADYARMHGESVFCSILGDDDQVEEYAERMTLLPLLDKNAERLEKLVSSGKSPFRKSVIEDRGLEDEDHVFAQVFSAFILGLRGNPLGVDAILDYLRAGPEYYRRVAVSQLKNVTAEGIGSPPQAWIDALAEAIDLSDEDAFLVGEAIGRIERKELVARLASARERASEAWSPRITRQIVELIDDERVAMQLIEESVSRLKDLGEAMEWGWVVRDSLKRLSEPNHPRLREWLRQILDRVGLEPDLEPYFRLLRRTQDVKPSLANAEDIPRLETLLEATKSNSEKSDIIELLSQLQPERRIALRLSVRGAFEDFAYHLMQSVRPDEVDQIIAAAEKWGTASDSFGESSVEVLWLECGERGREVLQKHASRLTNEGARRLIWIVEGITLKSAAALAVELGLADGGAKLLIEVCEKKPNYSRMPLLHNPARAYDVLEAAGRSVAFDFEDCQIPPRYRDLVEWFCAGSRGQLKAGGCAVVSPKKNLEDAASFRLELVCNGETRKFKVDNCGDYFDVGPVVDQLHAMLEGLGSEERFHRTQDGAYLFGPRAVIAEYGTRLAIPFPESGGPGFPTFDSIHERARRILTTRDRR